MPGRAPHIWEGVSDLWEDALLPDSGQQLVEEEEEERGRDFGGSFSVLGGTDANQEVKKKDKNASNTRRANT